MYDICVLCVSRAKFCADDFRGIRHSVGLYAECRLRMLRALPSYSSSYFIVFFSLLVNNGNLSGIEGIDSFLKNKHEIGNQINSDDCRMRLQGSKCFPREQYQIQKHKNAKVNEGKANISHANTTKSKQTPQHAVF